MTYHIITSCQNQQTFIELQHLLQDLNVALIPLAEHRVTTKKKHRICCSSKQRLIYTKSLSCSRMNFASSPS